MKLLTTFIRRGNRNRSVVLITIGLAMFAGSNLAENVMPDWTTREVVELFVILTGITTTAVLFRQKGADNDRDEKERFDVR
ncbi:MAG: hypothetical protein JWO80_5008 [Bryobacterales bacterium]|nr:hypothetical protein [Bryobacterales bacterium]